MLFRSVFNFNATMYPYFDVDAIQGEANDEQNKYLGNHVIARLPLRQWVLSVPKRLRYHLERDCAVLNAALHIFSSGGSDAA